MTEQGLIGFRFREQDKLTYNRSGSAPDQLGLQILHELRAVNDWDPIKKRISKLNAICETNKPGYNDGMLFTELGRQFP